jgi:hypothetical protein
METGTLFSRERLAQEKCMLDIQEVTRIYYIGINQSIRKCYIRTVQGSRNVQKSIKLGMGKGLLLYLEA